MWHGFAPSLWHVLFNMSYVCCPMKFDVFDAVAMADVGTGAVAIES